MIAQEFARVRVLGAFSRGARGGIPRTIKDGSIATPYGVATMCAHAGKVVRVREGESGRSQGGDDVPGATRFSDSHSWEFPGRHGRAVIERAKGFESSRQTVAPRLQRTPTERRAAPLLVAQHRII